jgi:hypothetical protein
LGIDNCQSGMSRHVPEDQASSLAAGHAFAELPYFGHHDQQLMDGLLTCEHD